MITRLMPPGNRRDRQTMHRSSQQYRNSVIKGRVTSSQYAVAILVDRRRAVQAVGYVCSKMRNVSAVEAR